MKTNVQLTGRKFIKTVYHEVGQFYDVELKAWRTMPACGTEVIAEKKYADLSVHHVPERLHPHSTISLYENRVTIRVPGVQPDHLKGVQRGAVGAEFGGKMRRRFLNAINSWRVPENTNQYFVTLTYPAEFSLDWQDWKADLEKFRRRLLKIAPGAVGYWKLELQRRGAPHFHLLLALPDRKTAGAAHISYKRLKRQITRFWAEIAHADDQYGGRYATNVRPIRHIAQLRAYVGKYAAKSNSGPINQKTGEIIETLGRQWGRIQRPDEREYAEIGTLAAATISGVKSLLQMWLSRSDRASDRWLADQFHPDDHRSITVYVSGLALLIADTPLSRLLDDDERRRVLSSL